jgi:hypothetical protein
MKAAPMFDHVRPAPARTSSVRRRRVERKTLSAAEQADRQGLGAARGVVIGLVVSVLLFWLPLAMLLLHHRRP